MTLRDLPAVSRLLAHPRTERLLVRFNREYVVDGFRDILDELRRAIAQERVIDAAALEEDAILDRLEVRLRGADATGLQRVVNATGTVLHTNLGRALLAQPAVAALVQAATQPVNLEYDLAQGERGRREQAIEDLLMDLTGAEAATVVNNNAAAVLLVLNTLASGKEVIVSRGELIEIGGAFRIPEIMARSGAILKEVGTTNRTHPADYENAITERTALLLKVHTSNYRIVGFVAEVGLPDLVAIGRAHGLPVVEDLGSGALVDLSRHQLPKEPVVAERVALGPDLVTFSGDKVLGGPQAGLIVGKADRVRAIAANPLHRAVRCDKLTIAALEATLRLYRESACIVQDIPVLNAITRPLAEIQETAERALPALRSALGPGFRVSVQDSTSQIGSGALPTEEVPTKVIAIEHDFLGAHRIAGRFRQARPPIIGRVSDDWFLLDVRLIIDPLDLVPNWADELDGPAGPRS
ncbi:MAG: L-seryl-tRNA(Sec) selenium transferase [Acidobacteria bacterium RIFCSPLOWO2_02_FULL_68_18]|nr:MAG: L-seryl-tRNA(Sec) selenium transferase [Acidobacteria bacterium RIFCSPLOWO2_02_FULL_68_18]OFW51213.1 MAG: L-seryl-tRNA(Sec) selenium transferase [Acidobacteria bacterium RIFCSPLOWO2_12_FULL_68_19]